MPRPPRADEAGGLYHALNRGNLRATIFPTEADYAAFERILHEALEIHQVELFSFQLMPNHYHLVLRPLVDGEMSRFKMTTISLSFAVMSNETHCGLNWSIGRRIGDEDHCGIGCKEPNLGCFPLGHCRDCPVGLIASTSASVKMN